MIIRGERISLKPLEKEDFLEVMQNFNLEDMQYGGILISQKDLIEERYKKILEGMKNKNTYCFSIVLNEENKIIGITNVSKDNFKEDIGWIGIYLKKEYRGKGYGTEALKLLCFFSFIILGLRKLKLEVFAFNERAIKCYKKVGFREVGIEKEERWHFGKYHDMVLMELLAREFLEKEREFIEKIKKINNISII